MTDYLYLISTYRYEETAFLTWFIRWIVPLVFAASTHTTMNNVGGFILVLQGARSFYIY